MTILDENNEKIELEFEYITVINNPDNYNDTTATGTAEYNDNTYTINMKTSFFDKSIYSMKNYFIANCSDEVMTYGGAGSRNVYYYEIINLKIKFRNIDNTIIDPYIYSVDFSKLISVPKKLEELIDVTSVVINHEQYFSLYEDISPFVVSDRNTYNFAPPGSTHTWDNLNIVSIDENGNSYCDIGRRHMWGGKGIVFTLYAGRSCEIWIKMGQRAICELKTVDGEVVDLFVSDRYHDGKGSFESAHHWFNCFNINNDTEEDILYYVVFSYPDAGNVSYSSIYDVKILLNDVKIFDAATEPRFKRHTEGIINLTNEQYQYINPTVSTTINLPATTDVCNDINVVIDTRPILYLYNKCIKSDNTLLDYGYCSQYIPVTPGTSINFNAQTVDTNNIELLQYDSMDNVRKTPEIARNSTVTLNTTTNYLRINCWDYNPKIPESIFINSQEYQLMLVDTPSVLATPYSATPATTSINLPTNCNYISRPVFELNKVYHLHFVKVGTVWTCEYVNDERTITDDGSTGGEAYVDEAELDVALAQIFGNN